MNPLSGPKGSPFDAKVYPPSVNASTINAVKVADPTNYSTGAMSNGIGFGLNVLISPMKQDMIKGAGFTDDDTPGVTFPDGVTLATDTRMLFIGGGRSVLANGTGPNGNGTPPGTLVSVPSMYNAQPIAAFGNGASRDAGAGPAFTSFGMKMVTADALTANGEVLETGFTNRTGVSMKDDFSAFGSAVAATAAPV
jgi:hypothetical protein